MIRSLILASLSREATSAPVGMSPPTPVRLCDWHLTKPVQKINYTLDLGGEILGEETILPVSLDVLSHCRKE